MEDYTATSVVLLDKQNETEAEAKAEVVAGNLIGAYRMVRRFRNFIQPWLALQKSSSMSQRGKSIRHARWLTLASV